MQFSKLPNLIVFEISIEVLGYNGEYVALPPIYKGETTFEGTHPLNKVKTGPCMVEGLDNNLVQHVAYKIAKNLNSTPFTIPLALQQYLIIFVVFLTHTFVLYLRFF